MSFYTKFDKSFINKYSSKTVSILRKTGWSFIRTWLIVGISFIIVYPLLVKLSVAIMSKEDLYDLTVKWIARKPSIENFIMAFKAMKFESALLKTLFISVVVTILQISSCALAAYGITRLKFFGSKLIFALIIFSLIVPPQTYLVSTYSQFRFFDPLGLVTAINGQAGIMNTYWPFIIKSVTAQGILNGLFVYIMRQFFRSMPFDLEEAAYVDGAGVFKTFYSIMLPNAVPAIVTVCMFSFIRQWNDDFYSALFAPRINFLAPSLYNITNIIINFNTSVFVNESTLLSAVKNAGALMMVFPLILLFIFSQKYFVESLERSGIVG